MQMPVKPTDVRLNGHTILHPPSLCTPEKRKEERARHGQVTSTNSGTDKAFREWYMISGYSTWKSDKQEITQLNRHTG